jgi:hypothetical protein
LCNTFGNLSLHHRVQTGSGAHPAYYLTDTRGFFPGVKRSGREADHSSPSSANVKNAWSYISTPPIRLQGVVCSVKTKHVDNFIFTFIYEGVSKSFRTESITKQTVTTNTRLEATQRVMAAKLTRLTQKIAIKPQVVAVQKLLDTTSYLLRFQ